MYLHIIIVLNCYYFMYLKVLNKIKIKLNEVRRFIGTTIVRPRPITPPPDLSRAKVTLVLNLRKLDL